MQMKSECDGTLRPETPTELAYAIGIQGIEPSEVRARINHEGRFSAKATFVNGANDTGYLAEIVTLDGRVLFPTNGFAQQGDLEAVLAALGVAIEGGAS